MAEAFDLGGGGPAGSGWSGFSGYSGPSGLSGSSAWSGAVGGDAGKIYYLDIATSSDLVGGAYKVAADSPSINPESTSITENYGTSETLISVFASNPGSPGATSLPAGTAYRHIHAKVDVGVAKYKLELFKRDSIGTETPLRIGYSPSFSNTSIQEVVWVFSDSNSFSMDVTDRVLFKLYVARVSGPDPVTVTTYFNGTDNTGYIQTTISSGAVGTSGFSGISSASGMSGWSGLGFSGSSGISGTSGSGASGFSSTYGASGWSGFSGGGGSGTGITWTAKTAGYTASNGDGILADTLTTSAWTLTLPISPSVGNMVSIVDSKGYFATNNLTVGRNGEKIQGLSADLLCNANFSAFDLVYTGTTNGWQIKDYLNAGPDWTTKTGTYAAVSGDKIMADTQTTSAWTLTLPSSPGVGEMVSIIDSKGYFATNNLTVARNGSLIMGYSQDLVCNANYSAFDLVYTGSTNGWQIKEYLNGNTGWTTQTTTYSASAGDRVMADTSTSGAWTMTLPASPGVGSMISVMDCKGNFGVANLTIGRNGSLIMGASADLTCNVTNGAFDLVYTGATKGWMIKDYLEEGSNRWVAKTADYSAVVNDGILADTLTVGAWTLTLPASPQLGDMISVIDAKRYFPVNNLTIAGNGSRIMGVVSNLICSLSSMAFDLIYTGPTLGWQIKSYQSDNQAYGGTKGYFAGGYTGAKVSTTDKITFSTDTTAAATTANLTTQKFACVGVSEGSTKGYVAGGTTGADVNTADKITFSGDTTAAATTANLSQARDNLAGLNGGSTKGYFAGGTTGAKVKTADKITFGTDTTVAQTTSDLSQERYGVTGASDTISKGYFAGGSTGTPVNTTDKIIFSTDATSAQTTANLSSNRESSSGVGSAANKCYFSGGNTGANVVTTDKVAFSTDVLAATVSANLTQARGTLAGLGEWKTKGYLAGGTTGGGVYVATTDKVTISTDVTSAQTTANLTSNKGYEAALSDSGL